jgi:hypothetical protein
MDVGFDIGLESTKGGDLIGSARVKMNIQF